MAMQGSENVAAQDTLEYAPVTRIYGFLKAMTDYYRAMPRFRYASE